MTSSLWPFSPSVYISLYNYTVYKTGIVIDIVSPDSCRHTSRLRGVNLWLLGPCFSLFKVFQETNTKNVNIQGTQWYISRPYLNNCLHFHKAINLRGAKSWNVGRGWLAPADSADWYWWQPRLSKLHVVINIFG